MRHCMQGRAASWSLWTAAVLLTLGVTSARADEALAATSADEALVATSADEALAATSADEATPVAEVAPATLDLGGFLAFADPETGEVRAPNAEEAAALAQALGKRGVQLHARSVQPIQVRTLPNGMEAALLGLESVNFSFAQIQADGSVAFTCGLDHDHSEDVSAPRTDNRQVHQQRRATRPVM